MLILAHGDEIKTHVERSLGGRSAIDNTLLYPTLQCEAVLRNHLAHVVAVLRANQCAGRPSGARVVQFLRRQS